MRPQACTEPLFRTTLRDTVTEEVTVLHHQSKYIQVWTGGECKQRFRLARRAFLTPRARSAVDLRRGRSGAGAAVGDVRLVQQPRWTAHLEQDRPESCCSLDHDTHGLSAAKASVLRRLTVS